MYKRKNFVWSVIIWTLLIAGFFSWNLIVSQSSLENSVKVQGRAYFDQVQLTRQWNAEHSGVYVPITNATQPNLYLETKNREVYIDSLDIALTKVNPAYMTRQIAELAKKENGIQFHITSLKPVRKKNKPDIWEEVALKSFEDTTIIEAFSMETIDDKKYYRYMKPLYVNEACIDCHQYQGYKLGDIRGGISVSIPAESNLMAKKDLKLFYSIIYFLIYVVGLIALVIIRQKISIFSRSRREQRRNLERANEELQSEITLRKKQELEIKKNKGKFEAIYKGANDAIFLMNDYNFVDCNDATLRLFDCEREDIIGHNPIEFSPEKQANGEQSSELASYYIQQVISGESQTYEWVHHTKDKKLFYAQVSLNLISLEEESLIVAMVKDITIEKMHKIEQETLTEELKEKQEELRERNEDLQTQSEKLINQQKIIEQEKNKASKASEYKSLFLASMSHEIRTPLNGVVGMLSLLKDTDLKPSQKEYIDVIDISSNNLLNIINDILDYSKIEANELKLEEIPINIPQLASEVVKMLEYKSSSKGLELSLTVDPNVHQFFVGDPVRLKQILINYCNNAINFTEKGTVKIIVSIIDETDDRACLKFEVVDTGIGISKEHQSMLFQEFTQVDNSISRKYGGTGLGLAISRKISHLMDGEVGVESELGEGSTFWFTVNLAKVEVTVKKKKVKNNVAAKGLSILLVEDNLINQKVAIHTLKRNDHEIDIAANGLEALEKFKNNKYDVILMDIQMPKMNGYDATIAIRKIEKEGKMLPTRIVAMTASVMKGEMEKCLDLGMDDYISKPFKQEDLLKIL